MTSNSAGLDLQAAVTVTTFPSRLSHAPPLGRLVEVMHRIL